LALGIQSPYLNDLNVKIMKTSNLWLFEAPFVSEAADYNSPDITLNAEWESLFEAPTPAAPSLIRSEAQPPFSTLYLNINLGCSTKRDRTKVCPQLMTGVFLPENYRFTPQVDLILYLQGHHRNPVQRGRAPAPGYYPTNLTIDQYWNRQFYPFFAFREGVNASQKNVMLVAPTLGPRSESGSLIQAQGFDAYIDQVLAAIRTYYAPSMQFDQPLSLGNLILACHSGGGLPMRTIALSKAIYASRIRECWGFDCTYNTGDDTGWASWARRNPTSNLFIYYIANSQTAPLATSLQTQAKRQKLSNVSVNRSTTGNHNRVPITYWQSRINAAPFLHNR
jgi:hypothetical protein